MVETRTLKNGLRVIVKRMEGLLSVTMGVLVGTGAAYETDAEDGLSHFIEHVQFKGTPTRTAFEISDAFDALGAQVNAFTGKIVTCYYAKSTSERTRESFALLSDLFLNATFPEEELAREKGVILEEIRMDEDSPEDVCLYLLSRAAYGNAGFGRNILGPAENVKGFTREDIFAYKKKRYVPRNIVVAFAGNIGIDEAMALAEEHFGSLEDLPLERREACAAWHAEALFKHKKTEQVQFALAFPTVGSEDPARGALQVLNTILGGGLSSRLFKRVREELGLAYSVYSYTSFYPAAGLLGVVAAMEPANAQKAADAVREVIETMKRDGVTEEEVSRAKEQIKSGNIFSQESTSSQMLLYGRTLLEVGSVYDMESRMREIGALTRGDVLAALDRFLDFKKSASATVGDLSAPIRI